MKNFNKILTICFFTLIVIKSIAQEKFTNYVNSSNGETYEIQILVEENGEVFINIYAMSLDHIHKTGGILINRAQHDAFLNALVKAKIKYIEWVKIAKENNVKKLDKAFNISSVVHTFFLYGNEGYIHPIVNLYFHFKILESQGKIYYILGIETGELQSPDNHFIKVDGFALVFSSITEIDKFTTKISKAKITEFVNKQKKEDLFKN